MIKQFRIDRFNGIEFLVLECYERHTWSKSENDAYLAFIDAPGSIHIGISRNEFRILLDEWLSQEHSSEDSFYGLVEPIPVIDNLPCIVVRGAVVNNRVVSVAADFSQSVTPLQVMDSVGDLFEFIRSPHWRNTILNSISDYGSLFGSSED